MNAKFKQKCMKYFSRSHYLLAVIVMVSISCNNTDSSEQVSKDTSEKKFNPAGEQKHTDTYDPKVVATDTMYKNKDSVPE